MRRTSSHIVLFLVFFVGLFVSQRLVQSGVHRKSFKRVCGLVRDRFYAGSPELEGWWHQCQKEAKQFSMWSSREEFLKRVQVRLDQLESSHLNIFDPEADRRLWRGEGIDTGLRTRRFENRFVVSVVLPRSPAAEAGLEPGDEILLIDNERIRSTWQTQVSSGTYSVRRGEQTRLVPLNARPIQIDGYPSLHDLGDKIGLLKISSFRAEYFSKEFWLKVAEKLPSYKHLIVDLRSNAGGNIVATLRALSSFHCQGELLGRLSQPRKSLRISEPLPDKLDDNSQLAYLEQYGQIPLKTYKGYFCYQNKVTVFIDNETASVSEIFASSFIGHSKARVWGAPSAGDVLLATWYNLPQLGPGYSLSIPEALFLNTKGQSLERLGVWPERELSYDLEDALKGEDTWVKQALIDGSGF